MKLTITKHAQARLKERVGINKKACPSMAEKAFTHGVSHKSAKAKLKRYLTRLFLEYRSANNLRVYGRHVYVFSQLTLITVLHLPKNMEAALSKSGE